jgi:hypothetical protein
MLTNEVCKSFISENTCQVGRPSLKHLRLGVEEMADRLSLYIHHSQTDAKQTYHHSTNHLDRLAIIPLVKNISLLDLN